MARQPALAFDRLDHRGFFAADVGAGAAPHMDPGVRHEAGFVDLGELVLQHQPDFRILVAQVKISIGRLDHPGGDQHAFDEAVRIALEVVAVLEGAGLALVAIDGKKARRGLGAHQRPFAPGRKAGAAEAAQAGVAHDLDEIVARALARQARLQEPVAALRPIGGEILVRLPCMRVRALGNGGGYRLRRCAVGSVARRVSAPAIAQERLSHTRTVTAGGGGPSFTTSKCA